MAEKWSKAVLVVSFGTSYEETRKKTIEAIFTRVEKKYPDYYVLQAYTSTIIRKQLEKQHILRYSVQEAMEHLKSMGVKDVYVLSTHVIDGEEYCSLADTLNLYQSDFHHIKISPPLLGSSEDMERVVDILYQNYGQNDTLLLAMGHGTSHPADALYGQLNEIIRERNYDNFCIATVEGQMSLEQAISYFGARKEKRVKVFPFMLVAGDHANNDMAGEEEDSWKSVLSRQGYEVETVLAGMGEIDQIQNLYLEHLETILPVFYAVGVGPGEPGLMTIKALKVLQQVQVIAAPVTKSGQTLALDIVRENMDIQGKEIVYLSFPMTKDKDALVNNYQEQAQKILDLLEKGKRVAMVNIGDVSIYSTCSYIYEIISQKYPSEMIAGVPSFCAAAAALGKSLAKGNEPVHIIPASYGIEDALSLDGNLIMMKSGKEYEKIYDALDKRNRLECAGMVQNCGLTDEKIYHGLPEKLEQESYFTTIIVNQ